MMKVSVTQLSDPGHVTVLSGLPLNGDSEAQVLALFCL